MDVNLKIKNRKKDQGGQSVFEFIIFVPFLFVLFAVLVSIVGSINGSINQQKVTRGYFFLRLAHNSTEPNPKSLNIFWGTGNKRVGLLATGWALKDAASSPSANCYKIRGFVGELPAGEGCEDKVSESSDASVSTFIKVKTLYGLCGTTYVPDPNSGSLTDRSSLNNLASCEMK